MQKSTDLYCFPKLLTCIRFTYFLIDLAIAIPNNIAQNVKVTHSPPPLLVNPLHHVPTPVCKRIRTVGLTHNLRLLARFSSTSISNPPLHPREVAILVLIHPQIRTDGELLQFLSAGTKIYTFVLFLQCQIQPLFREGRLRIHLLHARHSCRHLVCHQLLAYITGLEFVPSPL